VPPADVLFTLRREKVTPAIFWGIKCVAAILSISNWGRKIIQDLYLHLVDLDRVGMGTGVKLGKVASGKRCQPKRLTMGMGEKSSEQLVKIGQSYFPLDDAHHQGKLRA